KPSQSENSSGATPAASRRSVLPMRTLHSTVHGTAQATPPANAASSTHGATVGCVHTPRGASASRSRWARVAIHVDPMCMTSGRSRLLMARVSALHPRPHGMARSSTGTPLRLEKASIIRLMGCTDAGPAVVSTQNLKGAAIARCLPPETALQETLFDLDRIRHSGDRASLREGDFWIILPSVSGAGLAGRQG